MKGCKRSEDLDFGVLASATVLLIASTACEAKPLWKRLAPAPTPAPRIYATPVPTVAPAPRTPFLGAPVPIPGTFEAENFDNGGEGIAFHESNTTNIFNNLYRTSSVEVDNCSEGGFRVGYVFAGEWLGYTITVAHEAIYAFEVRYATPELARSIRVYVDDADATGSIALPMTGSWTAWRTVRFPGVRLTQGVHFVKVVAESDLIDFNSFALLSDSGASPTPSLRPTTTPTPRPTSVPAGPTATPVPNWVDPKSFGAKGDGVTDDTAAFQLAANTKLPMRVTTPPVRYRFTGVVYLYNHVQGDGSMPKIYMDAPDGTANDSIFRIQTYTGAGITVSGLYLNGGWNTSMASDEHSHGIYIGGSKNITVENNVFEAMYGDGVYVGASQMGTSNVPSENIMIRNNTARTSRRCSLAAVIHAKGVQIRNNNVSHHYGYVNPVDLEPNPGNNNAVWDVVIDGNTFDVDDGGGIPQVRYLAAVILSAWAAPSEYPATGPGGNITLTNNTGYAMGGFVSIHTAGGASWRNVVQSGNTVTNRR